MMVVGAALLTGCSSSLTPPEQVKKSFAAFQESLRQGDRDGAVRRLTPETMALFNESRKLALAPGTTNLTSMSQVEVIIGYNAYWLIPRKELLVLSTAGLFGWAVQQGLAGVQYLTEVELHDVKADRERATAHLGRGNTVLTNVVVSFTWCDGLWKLDLKSILLAPEAQLAAVREERGLSKAEMAVLAIEAMNRQPIPVLRELLLAPGVRQMVVELRGKKPSAVYEKAIGELGAGRQSNAEELLEVYTAIHTNDQRLAFAQAVCSRSRWSKAKAESQFKRVLELDPSTPEGNCARYILDLDARSKVPENMSSLRLLTKRHPDNPLILWTMAVECRDHYRLTGETMYSKDAEACYRRLLDLFKVGPVLLHQTFANVLTEELHLNEEALKHRLIAVEQEPSSWTYEGLANTLTALERYDEANAAFTKLIEYDSRDAHYWHSWAISLFRQKKYADCIEKNRKILECDQSFFEAYESWGRCLESLGKYDEAVEKYKKAMALNPGGRSAYAHCIRTLGLLGRNDEALRMREQRDRIPTKSSGLASVGLTDATRPAFLSQLKGADLQTLTAVFGQPDQSMVHSATETDYTFKLWHEWDKITVRLEQDNGLQAMLAYRFKEGHATLDEWRAELWQDFGMKVDRIRITSFIFEGNEVCYEVVLRNCAPGINKAGLLVSTNCVLDPAGTTLAAVKPKAVVAAKLMIHF